METVRMILNTVHNEYFVRCPKCGVYIVVSGYPRGEFKIICIDCKTIFIVKDPL